jgi:hypothetical protein
VLCAHGDRRISRLEEDGRKTTLADRYDGKRLNSPNDLVYKSDGDLYFTDPPFGLPKNFEDPMKELPFQGVYRLSPDGRLTLLAKDVKAPNGIAFSPDEKTLYITDVDPERPAWLAYDVKETAQSPMDVCSMMQLSGRNPTMVVLTGWMSTSKETYSPQGPVGSTYLPQTAPFWDLSKQGYQYRTLPGEKMVRRYSSPPAQIYTESG